MLSLAACARVGVLAAWAALFGTHAVSLLRPAGGRLAPGFEARVGQRVSYALQLDGPRGERTVGSCSVWCARTDGGYRVSTWAQIADASFLPGFPQLRSLIAGGESATSAASQVMVSLEEDIDDAGWLSQIDASITAFSISARAHASLTAVGTVGSWSAGDAARGSFDFPTPKLHGISSVAVVSSLPAGLRLGSRFTIDLLGADLPGRRTTPRHAHYTVVAEEELATAVGTQLLMKVDEIGDDGVIAARLWCDATGLVYRQRFGESGVVLDLRTVDASRPPLPATSP